MIPRRSIRMCLISQALCDDEVCRARGGIALPQQEQPSPLFSSMPSQSFSRKQAITAIESNSFLASVDLAFAYPYTFLMPRAKSDNPMLVEQRRRRILDLLEQEGQITVRDLVERFSISAVTVRSDLDALSAAGAVVRSHGGAVRQLEATRDYPLRLKASLHRGEKSQIGRAGRQPGSARRGDHSRFRESPPLEIARLKAREIEGQSPGRWSFPSAILRPRAVPRASLGHVGERIGHGRSGAGHRLSQEQDARVGRKVVHRSLQFVKIPHVRIAPACRRRHGDNGFGTCNR